MPSPAVGNSVSCVSGDPEVRELDELVPGFGMVVGNGTSIFLDLCSRLASRRKGVMGRDCRGESPGSNDLLSTLCRAGGDGDSQSPTLFLAVVIGLREGVEAELFRLPDEADEDTMLLTDTCCPACEALALISLSNS